MSTRYCPSGFFKIRRIIRKKGRIHEVTLHNFRFVVVTGQSRMAHLNTIQVDSLSEAMVTFVLNIPSKASRKYVYGDSEQKKN